MQMIKAKTCKGALKRVGFMLARDVPKFNQKQAIAAITEGYTTWKEWSQGD